MVNSRQYWEFLVKEIVTCDHTDLLTPLSKTSSSCFLPTVVIEDDRIDEVLKGMTDKSSPGV